MSMDAADPFSQRKRYAWRRWRSIRAIASVWIVLGALSIVSMLAPLWDGVFSINLLALMLPNGIGLWRGFARSRQYARWWCWIVIGVVLLILGTMPLVHLAGSDALNDAKASGILAACGAGLMVAFLAWSADRELQRAGSVENEDHVEGGEPST